MRKYLINIALTAAVLTVGWGCSKSDDDTSNKNNSVNHVTANRTWNTFNDSGFSLDVDFAGNDSRPDWQAPSPTDYESYMIYQITLPYELRSWASEDDVMAVFINDEIRVVATPAITNDSGYYTYLLKILGNAETTFRQSFSYKYYNARLHRIFEYTDIGHFRPEEVIGLDNEFCLTNLTSAVSDIYPVLCHLEVRVPTDIREIGNDETYFFVMVGDECRGITKLPLDTNELTFSVFGKKEDETATLYCKTYSYYTKLKPTFEIVDGSYLFIED